MSHKAQIESTQKQAVIFLHKDNINRQDNDYVLRPYRERCDELGMVSLNRGRVISAVLWMHQLISGRIDSPYLRNQLNINTGERMLRNPDFIRIKCSRTEYGRNSPFNNACRAFNRAASIVDPTLPFPRFKLEVMQLPDQVFGDLIES